MSGTSDKGDHSERCNFCTFDIIDLGSITHIKFTLAMSDTKNKLYHRRPKFKQYFYNVSDSGDINVTLDM